MWRGLRHNCVPGLSPSTAPRFDKLLKTWSCPEARSKNGPLCGPLDSSFESTSSEEDKDMEQDEWVMLPEFHLSSSERSSASSSFSLSIPKQSSNAASSVEAVFPRLRIDTPKSELCPVTTSHSFTASVSSTSSSTSSQEKDDSCAPRRALFCSSNATSAARVMDFCSLLTSPDSSTVLDDSDTSQTISPTTTMSPASMTESISFQSTTSTISTSKTPVESLSSSFGSPISQRKMHHSQASSRAWLAGDSSLPFSASCSCSSGTHGGSNLPSGTSAFVSSSRNPSSAMWDHDEADTTTGFNTFTVSHINASLCGISSELQQLILAMLSRDPRKRPSTHELLKHRILSRFCRHRHHPKRVGTISCMSCFRAYVSLIWVDSYICCRSNSSTLIIICI